MGSFKRAIQDILAHRFLTAVTVVTVALAVLIVSAFALFFLNASQFMGAWKRGVRIMVYLESGLGGEGTRALEGAIAGMDPVEAVRFIPKDQALDRLREQMKGQASLFDTLDENPLPDAFEIEVSADFEDIEALENLAGRIAGLESVASVEYGRQWVERFIDLFNLFRLAAYAMGALFCVAAVFIVANTVRLVFHSRAEEVAILRLVGATEGFIRAPFYFQGLIAGALGAAVGLLFLFAVFSAVSSQAVHGLAAGPFQARFLPPGVMAWIAAGSMAVGWLGSFLSLQPSFGFRPADRESRPLREPPTPGGAAIRSLLFLAAGGWLAAAPGPALALDPGGSGQRVAVVMVERLNLRPSPSMDEGPSATLRRGDTVVILARGDDWWKVSADGRLGYVSGRGRFLQETPAPAGSRVPGGPPALGSAEDTRRRDDLQRQISRQELALAEAARDENQILGRLHAADRSLAALRQRRVRVEADIQALGVRIADVEAASGALQERVRSDSAHVRDRLVAFYKLSRLGSLPLIASAEGIADLQRRQTALRTILDMDRSRLDGYTRKALLLATLLGDLQVSRERKQALEEEARRSLAEAARETAQKKELLERVRGEKALELAALGALKESARDLDRALEGLGKAPPHGGPSAGQAGGFSGAKGLLIMPTRGKIILFFGPYRHPAYDVTNFHGGIDIRTDQGEPVLAVWSGEVVFSDWFKGFGNLVIVNHGDNYHTLYAHLAERFKEKGEPVEAGEVIATAGDSGPVSDCRLHFQIRHQGKPLDPLDWIARG